MWRPKRSFLQDQSLHLPILLGVSHGLADATAGFLLGMLRHAVSLEQAALLILMYNGLAFGGQPLLGFLVDRLQCPRLVVWIGLIALGLAVMLATQQEYKVLCIALAGLGSAAFHVGGGALSYWATPEKTIGTSLFVAPGVVGLAIGVALGVGRYEVTSELVGLLLGVAVAIAMTQLPTLPDSPLTKLTSDAQLPPAEEFKEAAVFLLIVAISMGSMVWTGLQLWLLGRTALVIGMAIAAGVGKIVGGWLSERWGWRRWTVTALGLAALLLVGGDAYPLALLLGVACLQSVVPVTLAAIIRLMPRYSATAAGLALGLAILVGGIPVLAGVMLFPQAKALVVVLLTGAAIALWHGLKPALFSSAPHFVASTHVSVEVNVNQSSITQSS